MQSLNLKLDVYADLARDFDKSYYKIIDLVHEFKGGVYAASLLEGEIAKLADHVDADVDDGLFDLEVAKHCKRYLSRAVQICANKQIQLQQMEIAKQGEAKAIEGIVLNLQKRAESTQQNIENVLNALEHQDTKQAPKSIKQQRLEEEQEEEDANDS